MPSKRTPPNSSGRAPAPCPGKVRVAMRAFGPNPAELHRMQGARPVALARSEEKGDGLLGRIILTEPLSGMPPGMPFCPLLIRD
ncbi:hypothetical protein ACK8OR_07425 [Jannaschia sp. KMU-145]|uniref:hypothetical protein n=1 Tax=Jannaschia halovivens TaxID=3388667 RepID=UPI00396B067A